MVFFQKMLRNSSKMAFKSKQAKQSISWDPPLKGTICNLFQRIFEENTKIQKYQKFHEKTKKQNFLEKSPPLTPFWNFEISPDLTFIRPLEHFEPFWQKSATNNFSLQMICSP